MSEPSLHVSPLIRSIASDPRNMVAVVLEEELSSARRDLGWSLVDHGNAKVFQPKSIEERIKIERGFDSEWAHVFWGLGVYRETARSMRRLRRQEPDSLIGVFSEPWNPLALRGAFRNLKYRAKYAKYGHSVDFVLAAGELAKEQFSSLGFRSDRIAQFAYFVEPEPCERPGQPMESGDGATQLLFVGQLVERKRPLSLINALAPMQGLGWHLTIAGSGNDAPLVAAEVKRMGLGSRVTLLGAVESSDIPALMCDADALIVPSEFDGWGAVVNEALVQGTRCLVSDMVGSNDLLSNERGQVFSSKHKLDFEETLMKVITQGRRSQHERLKTRDWARENISPAVGGQYLEAILDSVACNRPLPSAPWRRRD